MNNYRILDSISTFKLAFYFLGKRGGHEIISPDDLQAISALFYIVTKSVSKGFLQVLLFTAKYHFIQLN
jgi:hypothetical protein